MDKENIRRIIEETVVAILDRNPKWIGVDKKTQKEVPFRWNDGVATVLLVDENEDEMEYHFQVSVQALPE